ncbi:MAG: carbamoyltransferase HypF, partial [Cyanobacteria bacterium]|nr:carbamoyltransferase HypF [Cyanobacteriota bacterium]
PRLFYLMKGETLSKALIDEGEAAIEAAVALLRAGGILALKGLGGFHLACDAYNSQSVDRLRLLKHREAKPFAVMFSGPIPVKEHCLATEEELEILTGTKRPIVLLNKLSKRQLPGQIAPDTYLLGAMLPYTPLQHILLSDYSNPLVMTSGNCGNEPIAIGNREELADGFLFNDRDIATRYDDSVIRLFEKKEILIRRARGYAPAPIELPFHLSKTVLAVGGHLKNTFCLAKGNQAYLSPHIGDLDDIETVDQFRQALTAFTHLFRLTPDILACDLHPDYGSTRLIEDWKRGRGRCPFDFSQISQIIPVQHHFAHVVSCMTENSLAGPVIGVAFDGMGLGQDGHIWGGEFLSCTYSTYKRLAHLAYVGMPGGESAIREPWRMAIAYLDKLAKPSDEAVLMAMDALEERVGENRVSAAKRQLEVNFNTQLTSSCGRLFDAVSALLGLCLHSNYEGQAAVKLENLAKTAVETSSSGYAFALSSTIGSHYVIDVLPAIEEILLDLQKGADRAQVALRFHQTIADIISRTCSLIRDDTAISAVCLTGGVFQNVILTHLTFNALVKSGFHVALNKTVPSNDGGLSLGQAVSAGAIFPTERSNQ